MRVLVAPQEFKGSLTATEAAAAIAAGIRQSRPAWEIDVLPLSDGGPGFLEALAGAVPGTNWRSAAVHDALGRPREGRWLATGSALTPRPPLPTSRERGSEDMPDVRLDAHGAAGGSPADAHPSPPTTPLSREVGRGGQGGEGGTPAARSSPSFLIPHSSFLTVFLGAAEANGLVLIPPDERDALAADSFGVGELIAAALAERPARMVIGVGGSATTDGGAGMARALGARLLDSEGNDLAPGGGSLERLARIEWARPAAFEGIDVVVATDVTNPLTGPSGAAHVYGPQKGATPAECARLDAALARFAAVVRRDLGVDVASLPGAGAAGGLAAGLVAFLGARIESGFDLVAEVTHLRERLDTANLVVTGEGSFDGQSMQGKVTGRVLELARELGVPAIVLAGRASHAGDGRVATIVSIEPDVTRAMADAGALLTALAAREAAAFAQD